MLILLDTNINPEKYENSIIQWFNSSYIHHQDFIMDATHYWSFPREYSIWNVAVTALQFWMADLKPHILSDAIEWVYTAFFCSNSTASTEPAWRNNIQSLRDHLKWCFWMQTCKGRQRLQQWEWVLKDTHSSQKSTIGIYISTSENISFNSTRPLTTDAQHPEHSPRRLRSHSPVHHCLKFNGYHEENPSPDSSPLHGTAEPPSPVQHHMDYHHTPTAAQLTPSRMLQQKKKRKIFPQPHWMMTFGLKIQFQIDICVFMNSHSHIFCVLIPVHTVWICYPPLQKTPHHHTRK